MELTPVQTDSLTELINIGYARAANSLSELTGHRILLKVPQVAIHPIAKVGEILNRSLFGEVATVHQVFSGSVSGDALLLLDQRAAILLTNLLGNSGGEVIDASAEEVITEVGNIVLNACLGVFGNLLQVQVSFSMPRLHIESIDRVLRSITIVQEELQYALTIQTKFTLRESNIAGYLVIVLGVTSLDRLLAELENWEKRQFEL